MNWYITSVPLQPRRPNWKAQMDTGMEANERTVGMGSGCWWSEEYKSLAYSFGTNRSWSYSSTRNEIWWAEEATYSALAVHQISNRSHDHMKCINHTQSHLNSFSLDDFSCPLLFSQMESWVVISKRWTGIWCRSLAIHHLCCWHTGQGGRSELRLTRPHLSTASLDLGGDPGGEDTHSFEI